METTKTIKRTKIKRITVEKNRDVYDIQVRKNHNFFANGLLVHNCEIALRPYQFCNLTEVNVSDVESQGELNSRVKAAAFIGTLQAGYTDFHYLRDIWRRTTEKEALIGVSMTGIASGKVLNLDTTEASKVVMMENERVAKLLGINKAARTTTVKPAGTTSLTVGTSSGIHAWHNDYYIRRLRVGKNEAIYTYLSLYHPDMIEDEYFRPHDTAVISVPQKAPEGAIMRTESALQLLKRVAKISTEWVKPGTRNGQNTHNVSATISIKDTEWTDVGEWMWENREVYNGLSVLPADGGTYKQAPFTDCSKETYEAMLENLEAIDLTKVVEVEDNTDLSGELACSGGKCEIT
jgi:ribonucleoside-diphosphate reductase alpha chain